MRGNLYKDKNKKLNKLIQDQKIILDDTLKSYNNIIERNENINKKQQDRIGYTQHIEQIKENRINIDLILKDDIEDIKNTSINDIINIDDYKIKNE